MTTEELRRVIPLIERLAGSLAVPVSVDTRKPVVMRRAIAAGASLVNDVSALAAPGALAAVAESGAAACLMHMQGEPRTMQDAPHYDDVVGEVRAFLEGACRRLRARGHSSLTPRWSIPVSASASPSNTTSRSCAGCRNSHPTDCRCSPAFRASA